MPVKILPLYWGGIFLCFCFGLRFGAFFFAQRTQRLTAKFAKVIVSVIICVYSVILCVLIKNIEASFFKDKP